MHISGTYNMENDDHINVKDVPDFVGGFWNMETLGLLCFPMKPFSILTEGHKTDIDGL